MAQKTIDLEILNVGAPVFTKTSRGGYNSMEVAYKNHSFDGKVEGKKLVDFNDKKVFEFIKGLKAGDRIIVTAEKGEADQFWKWSAAEFAGAERPSPASGDAGSPVPPPTAPERETTTRSTGRVTGSNYETPEERARRQVYIVRQSSVTAALDFHKAQPEGVPSDLDLVLNTAAQIEAYVLAGYDVKKDGGIK